MVFDSDTLSRGRCMEHGDDARENFIDWRGVQFNGEHNIHPHLVGQFAVANSTGPGWANPATGEFLDDQRVEGRNGRRYGPLPRTWAKYRGLYHFGQKAIFSYTVGNAGILESPDLVAREDGARDAVFLRRFEIGPHNRELILRVADCETGKARLHYINAADPSVIEVDQHSDSSASLLFGVTPQSAKTTWAIKAGRLLLHIPAGESPLRFTVWTRPCSRR